jgi:hypothetical protein
MRSSFALALVITLFTPAAGRTEVIDRIMAVVDTQIITLSDTRAALRFALVPADVSIDPLAAALQRLIDRRLTIAEVDRYAPPEPLPAQVDAALSVIERRFQDALAMEIALNQTAMSREELRRFVRDTLRIDAYLQQRFASVVQASDDDVVRYYREHSAEFTVDGRLRPLDDVREAARAGAVREQRAAMAQQWLEGLRRRGSVQVLYLPQAPR